MAQIPSSEPPAWRRRGRALVLLAVEFRFTYISAMSLLAKATLAAFAAFASVAPAMAQTLELVLFERPGCVFCARWDREVGAVYPLTEVGKKAPLRRVNLAEGQPKLQVDQPVLYSPTFVLMKDGREVGRIIGYRDDAMFWGTFSRMVDRQNAPAL
jgi:thioredoxin-related protein